MFADLCTVANCSVFMMTDYYHGYYIHGRAPWEQSDLPIGWLKKELDSERDGKKRTRAIGSEALKAVANQGANVAQEVITSFEIYMTDHLRQAYNEALSV